MKKVLDISQHNGQIDFAKVKEAGINDLIIRIGWIGNKNNHTQDSMFNHNYMEAKKHGFNVGIYVFSYCNSVETLKSGCEWVKNLLNNKVLELPVFLDLEDDPQSSPQISSFGRDVLTSQSIEFCKYFEALGYKSGVYASKDWFNRLIDVNKIENYKIWLAEWGVSNPTVSFKVDLWQYTSNDYIDGISGRVDCSYCMCECDENPSPKVPESEEEEMKIYQNGSTVEPVYCDTNLTNKIGSLNPYEQCECFGEFNGRAMVRYKVDNKDNYKIGFCKWLGGIH